MPIIGRQVLRPKNDAANFYEIQDEDTDEWYVVTAPPVKYDNPSTWVADHYQCQIRRNPIQPAS